MITVFQTPKGLTLRVPPEVEQHARSLVPRGRAWRKWLDDRRTRACRYLWDWALAEERSNA